MARDTVLWKKWMKEQSEDIFYDMMVRRKNKKFKINSRILGRSLGYKNN